MSGIEWYIPPIAIGMVVTGYYAGHFFRDHTHAMIPFNEPLSYILLIITLMPLIMEAFFPSIAFVDPFDIAVIAVFLAFWVGYLLGYMQNRVDMVYVSVHNIVGMEQDTHPFVRYTNNQGQQCWQPQGFKEICKTVFFGVHNPLTFSGGQPTHVKMSTIVITQEKDSVNVAGLEINESEKVVFTIFGHEVKMKVEARTYISAPSCQYSPYDWLAGWSEVDSLATEYAELQVQESEAKAQIHAAQVKGTAMVMEALAGRNPSQAFIDELAEEFQQIASARASRGRRAAPADGPGIQGGDA